MNTAVKTSPGLGDLWRDRNFLLLWIGGLISSLGDQIYILAIPWILYTLTASAATMNTMRMVEFLPNILLGFITGLFVDRWPQRRTMIAAVTLQAVAVLVVPLAAHRSWFGAPLLFALGFSISVAGRFYSVAYETLIPTLFARARLRLVNAQLGMVATTARIIGPAVAGVLIGLAGADRSLWADVVSFAALGLAIMLLPRGAARSPHSMVKPGVANREAWTWLRQSGGLWVATWATSVINLFGGGLVILAIFHGRHDLHLSGATMGLALALAACGSVVGSFWTPPLVRRFRAGPVMTLSVILDGLGVALMAVSNTWWLIGLAFAFHNFTATAWNINYFTLRQGDTPHEILGRIASQTSMIMKLPILALPAIGLAADVWGAPATLMALALGLILIGFGLRATPLRQWQG